MDLTHGAPGFVGPSDLQLGHLTYGSAISVHNSGFGHGVTRLRRHRAVEKLRFDQDGRSI